MGSDRSWEFEAEAAGIALERRMRKSRDAEATGTTLADLLARISSKTGPVEELGELPCGATPWPVGDATFESGKVYSDGGAHYVPHGPHARGLVSRRCPTLAAREVQESIEAERIRLRGELAQISRFGPTGFEQFDPNYPTQGGHQALRMMQEFASARPPRTNVVLAGTTGLGKSRLLLASHFELRGAGVASMYITTPLLRIVFMDLRSFNEERRTRAESFMTRLCRAQVIHFDDIGNVDKDSRKRGEFAEGVKDILDRSEAVWASAMNMDWDEAIAHPDLGTKIVSRLGQGAKIVNLVGEDYRLAHASEAQ